MDARRQGRPELVLMVEEGECRRVARLGVRPGAPFVPIPLSDSLKTWRSGDWDRFFRRMELRWPRANVSRRDP